MNIVWCRLAAACVLQIYFPTKTQSFLAANSRLLCFMILSTGCFTCMSVPSNPRVSHSFQIRSHGNLFPWIQQALRRVLMHPNIASHNIPIHVISVHFSWNFVNFIQPNGTRRHRCRSNVSGRTRQFRFWRFWRCVSDPQYSPINVTILDRVLHVNHDSAQVRRQRLPLPLLQRMAQMQPPMARANKSSFFKTPPTCHPFSTTIVEVSLNTLGNSTLCQTN